MDSYPEPHYKDLLIQHNILNEFVIQNYECKDEDGFELGFTLHELETILKKDNLIMSIRRLMRAEFLRMTDSSKGTIYKITPTGLDAGLQCWLLDDYFKRKKEEKYTDAHLSSINFSKLTFGLILFQTIFFTLQWNEMKLQRVSSERLEELTKKALETEKPSQLLIDNALLDALNKTDTVFVENMK